jgi:glycosyltransferase involved in cell wall biosynthesis
MKRLFFVNRYFHPDHSATSQLVSDLAFHVAASGRQVCAITSQQLYDDAKFRLPATETIRGINVVRVPTSQFGRAGLIGRAVDYFSFYASAWRALRKLVKRGDVIVAMTDPPLVSIPAMQVATGRGAHLINWMQDVYPEVAFELGVPVIRGPIKGTFAYLRDRTLQMAAANVVVGQRMRDKITSLGAATEKIQVIHNWCDDEQISPVSNADNPLRRDWGLENKFVVGYSGNLGRGHEFDTVLAASERLRHNPRIVFIFIGGGHRMDELERIVKSRRLDTSFRFVPYQDRINLKQSLGVPDVHWISLKPAVEGMIVPSKFYGIAAAGRPTIAITARDGEIARLVLEHSCGLVIEPGQADALAEAIARLSNDPQSLAAMGQRARAMLEAHFTRRQALDRWSDVLDRVEHP